METRRRVYPRLFIIGDSIVLAGALVFATSGVLAKQAHTQTQTTATTESTADRRFASEAASGGMSEVKLGELAKEKGSSQTVKSFGERMATDHSKANDELKQAAQEENIQIPSEPNRMDQSTYDRLSKLSGPEFDRAYAKEMVKDHEKDVAEFQKEASSGKNPKLKEFASRTLPTLQDHLRQAKEMERTVTSSTSSYK